MEPWSICWGLIDSMGHLALICSMLNLVRSRSPTVVPSEPSVYGIPAPPVSSAPQVAARPCLSLQPHHNSTDRAEAEREERPAGGSARAPSSLARCGHSAPDRRCWAAGDALATTIVKLVASCYPASLWPNRPDRMIGRLRLGLVQKDGANKLHIIGAIELVNKAIRKRVMHACMGAPQPLLYSYYSFFELGRWCISSTNNATC